MREAGVRGVLIYCSDYYCSHSVALTADRWGDDVRLSDLEPRFVCSACGKRAPMCGRISTGTKVPSPRWDTDDEMPPLRRLPCACGCGAPGAPCPICNRPDSDTVPELPDGFAVDTRSEDWS